MPTWLINQLTDAYLKKDIYQIKVLNQCWFFYQSLYKRTPASKNKTNRMP
ncbi:hypothetical protein J416_11195 [Gracilibacillus halophilus YIM-C55.5]|uniref:Cortex morphogenetic protein CmpA n=1 Tax=Gracilibacillus halophilus YIM-C55.5 TaxID=1308866 RepID=N4WTB0_9BACI|nr:cortex morphogenetic protein CmpA [Gracilibacillus halophilus]ENH96401.1 hypothetical protein J416_11195 [Gracilibacillus halophilus YIM-C55.5]